MMEALIELEDNDFKKLKLIYEGLWKDDKMDTGIRKDNEGVTTGP